MNRRNVLQRLGSVIVGVAGVLVGARMGHADPQRGVAVGGSNNNAGSKHVSSSDRNEITDKKTVRDIGGKNGGTGGKQNRNGKHGAPGGDDN